MATPLLTPSFLLRLDFCNCLLDVFPSASSGRQKPENLWQQSQEGQWWPGQRAVFVGSPTRWLPSRPFHGDRVFPPASSPGHPQGWVCVDSVHRQCLLADLAPREREALAHISCQGGCRHIRLAVGKGRGAAGYLLACLPASALLLSAASSPLPALLPACSLSPDLSPCSTLRPLPCPQLTPLLEDLGVSRGPGPKPNPVPHGMGMPQHPRVPWRGFAPAVPQAAAFTPPAYSAGAE